MTEDYAVEHRLIASGRPRLETYVLPRSIGHAAGFAIPLIGLRRCTEDAEKLVEALMVFNDFIESVTRIAILVAKLTQQAIDGIVAGCPALRRLEINCCLGFHRLEIGGQSFRYLEVQGRHNRNSESSGGEPLSSVEMEISAPYMRELKAMATSSIWNLRLVDVSSLEKARIDLYNEPLVSNEGKNSHELL
ncbi:hypothetical protein OROHE_011064 [Orobanche hederae]